MKVTRESTVHTVYVTLDQVDLEKIRQSAQALDANTETNTYVAVKSLVWSILGEVGAD